MVGVDVCMTFRVLTSESGRVWGPDCRRGGWMNDTGLGPVTTATYAVVLSLRTGQPVDPPYLGRRATPTAQARLTNVYRRS